MSKGFNLSLIQTADLSIASPSGAHRDFATSPWLSHPAIGSSLHVSSGLSQTFPVVAKCSGIGQYSGFINHLKSEAEREQFVLSTNGPLPSKVEAFLEPEHRLEARDRSLRRGERSETSGFRHVLLHVKVIAFNPLLQVLGDAVLHVGRRQAVPGAVLYGLGIDTRAVRPDLARGQQGLVLQSLAEKPLGGGEIAPGRKQKIDGRAVLVDGPVEIAPFAPDLHILN